MAPARAVEEAPAPLHAGADRGRGLAFRVTEVGGDPDSAYNRLKIREGVRFRYPRESVSLTDLPEGAASDGGTITIDGESFPVMRPNQYGDPNTDELIAVMAGMPAVTWPR